MAYLADAHTDWHHANPHRPWDCPLDCGAGIPTGEDYELPATANTPPPATDPGPDPWTAPFDPSAPF